MKDEENYFLYLFEGDNSIAIAELSYCRGLENVNKAEKSILEDGWVIKGEKR